MPVSPRKIVTDGVDARLAGGRLTIDLDALVTNWKALERLSAPAKTGAVVKSDAYGCGLAHIVPALANAGCDRFFVALTQEGVLAKRLAPSAEVFVLNGLFSQSVATVAEAGLIPVLSSVEEIAVWAEYWQLRGGRRPCALHVDTGMNRMGLSVDEALEFAADPARRDTITPILIISHLACADEPAHPLNRQQVDRFNTVVPHFPGVEASMANSAGVFLGPECHFDLTRPGIALYGGEAVIDAPNPMRPVVRCETRIAQLRRVPGGETISYGASQTLLRDTLVATCSIGYSDGYHRSLSGSGVELRKLSNPAAFGYAGGKRVPVLGRVTMDLVMFDVTDLSDGAVQTGDHIELFGANIALDDVARAAGTIGYELLTGLGQRYHRRYLQPAGER